MLCPGLTHFVCVQWYRPVVLGVCRVLQTLDGKPVLEGDRLDTPLDGLWPGRASPQGKFAAGRKLAARLPSISFDDLLFDEGRRRHTRT